MPSFDLLIYSYVYKNIKIVLYKTKSYLQRRNTEGDGQF